MDKERMGAPTNIRSSAIPTWDLSGLTIVDVGCGDGWRFDLPQFTAARRLIGVECDTATLQAGRHRAERVEFFAGVAERLPLGDGEVDAYLSFVALPYTDIPAAIAEAFRVLRPGGRLQVTLHDWRHQVGWFMAALRGLAIMRLLDHAYIVAHSAWLAWTGRCFGRPWNRRLESFQTQTRTRLLFTNAGFEDVKCYRTARHLIVEAVKPIAVC